MDRSRFTLLFKQRMKQTKYFCQACFQIEMFGQTNLNQHEHYYKAERVNSEHQHQQTLADNHKRYENWLNNYRAKKAAQKEQL